ncbi:MAG TPA: cytochrome c biogenesis protein CcsA [Nitrospiria bacterium]
MATVFLNLTLLFYLLGTLFFMVYLWGGEKDRLSRLSVAGTAAGFVFHTLTLLGRKMEAGFATLTHLSDAMVFFAWALVLVFLVVEYRFRIHILGSFVLPLALISLLSVSIFPAPVSSGEGELKMAWVYVHTAMALLGAVAFAVASLAGIMYLIQERLLKSKRLNDLYNKLPSLDILDDLNRRAVMLGFGLLTLGIIIGAWGAGGGAGSFLTSWDPRKILTLVIWGFYLVVLHGRITMGWRAKRAAYLAIFGFVCVIVSFVGVDLIWKGEHAFI